MDELSEGSESLSMELTCPSYRKLWIQYEIMCESLEDMTSSYKIMILVFLPVI